MAGPRSRGGGAPGAGRPRRLPLWPLPLVAAALPALAALFGLLVYRDADGTACNPFVEDCVSISRMARHGWPNHAFRALVMPAAVLQALTWLVAARTFRGAGLSRRAAWPLAVVGAGAGVALVVYAGFLGSEGEVYRWLRRWGTLLYFGGTYLAMIAFAGAAQRLHGAGCLLLPRAHGRSMAALLAFVAALAIVHAVASLGHFAVFETRIENLTEWWGALALTTFFGVIAALWRRWRLTAGFALERPGG